MMPKKKTEEKVIERYYVFTSYMETDDYNGPSWYYVGEANSIEEAEDMMEEIELESFCRHMVIKGIELDVDKHGLNITRFQFQ